MTESKKESRYMKKKIDPNGLNSKERRLLIDMIVHSYTILDTLKKEVPDFILSDMRTTMQEIYDKLGLFRTSGRLADVVLERGKKKND